MIFWTSVVHLLVVVSCTDGLLPGAGQQVVGGNTPGQIRYVFDEPVNEIANKEGVILTPHNFPYLINNPNACKNAASGYGDDKLDLVIVIHSWPKNFARRQTCRDSFMRFLAQRPDIKSTAVFVMGWVPDEETMNRVTLESSQFKDIVQEDFVDAYRNITLKNQMWMRWVFEACPMAQIVLKTDDDMFIDIPRLIEHVRVLRRSNDAGLLPSRPLWCAYYHARGMPVLRSGKWGVPKTLFSDEFYPAYCSGSAYLLTVETALAMFKASQETPFFWVDDAWATGMVAARAKVTHIPSGSAYIFGGGFSLNERIAEYHSPMDTRTFGHFPNDPDILVGLVEAACERSKHTCLMQEDRALLPGYWWRHQMFPFPATINRKDLL